MYNVLGQEVKSLLDRAQPAGLRAVCWDRTDNLGRRVGPGTFFCRLSAGNTQRTLKLVLVAD